MIIDVHAHYFPSDFMQFLAQAGITGVTAPRRKTPLFAPPQGAGPRLNLAPENLDFRFAAMAKAGVAKQILSSATAPYSLDASQAVTGARMINDAYADLVQAHPDRLGFWASLPLPHVAESLTELTRAMDEQGAVGVVLSCFCLNESVVRAEFDPIFEELNRRAAPVFFHPCQNGVCSHLVNEWGLTVCAGASMEDSVVAMHLIVQQIPSRFPDTRFIIPHFGGILPTLLERLDGQMPQEGFAERPSVTAKRFFYDTVGWGSKAALLAAYTAFGDTQIVPGSDWPILLSWESYTQTFEHVAQSGLPADSIDRILHRNAPALLGGAARS